MDELTGLLNQKSYLNKTASLSGDVTPVVLDVDDFKQVNDNHGHLTGDQCLKEVADCIKDAYSRYGLCYRIRRR
ncbi:MAG: diguanylate cyclase [Anaerovoracaceae bacterium]